MKKNKRKNTIIISLISILSLGIILMGISIFFNMHNNHYISEMNHNDMMNNNNNNIIDHESMNHEEMINSVSNNNNNNNKIATMPGQDAII